MTQTAAPVEVAQAYCNSREWTLVGSVGAGVFKETFHVLRADSSPIALKVYKPTSSRERSEREIIAMKRCSHQNIATLLSVEPFDYLGTPYLLTTEEFLSGGTLSSRLRAGMLTPEAVQSLALSLVDALAHT